MNRFHDATIAYKELFEQAYGTPESRDHADSIMKRLGNICYRIMMILTASRLMENEGDLPNEITCNDSDFAWVLHLSEMFMQHTLFTYDELMVETGKIPDIGEENIVINPNAQDLLTDLQRQFLNLLPQHFIKRDALCIARDMELNPYTGSCYLKLFLDLGIISRCGRGSYVVNNKECEA